MPQSSFSIQLLGENYPIFKKDYPNRTIINDFREMPYRHFAPSEWGPCFEILVRNFYAGPGTAIHGGVGWSQNINLCSPLPRRVG